MKLETSEGERAELTAWCTMKTEEWKSGFAPELTEQTVWAKTARLLRDIDTLLAEVERLRGKPPLMAVPEDALLEMLRTGSSMVYVNPVPGEVWRAPPAPPLPAEVEEMRKKLDGPHEWGYRCLAEGPFFISDPAPFAAASLLSRWPGVWRPMESAPRDGWPCILESAEGWVGEAWFSEDSDGWWMVNTHPTDAHDGQVLNPTGWMPLPAPGAAP